MMLRRSDVHRFYLSVTATALVWAGVGAAIASLVMGYPAIAVGLLLLSLCAWPFRLKFKVHRLKADNFEEAMREIMDHERREGR